MQISAQVECIAGAVVRQYLIHEPVGLTLIDAGLPGNEGRVLRAIAAAGRSPGELKRILITHADGDHYGAANALRAATGARIYASSIEAEAMQAGQASRPLRPTSAAQRLLFRLIAPLFTASPTAVDEILAGGETLPVLNGLQVLLTPGHTPGHISFFDPAERILFSGDSIVIDGGTPAPSRGGNTWDIACARASFEQQLALAPVWICGGHGIWPSKRPANT